MTLTFFGELNTFFEDAIRDECYLNDKERKSDSVHIAIKKFENHRIFASIKQNKIFQFNRTFVFLTLTSAMYLKKPHL